MKALVPLLMQVAWTELEPLAAQWKVDKDAGKEVVNWDASGYTKKSRGINLLLHPSNPLVILPRLILLSSQAPPTASVR